MADNEENCPVDDELSPVEPDPEPIDAFPTPPGVPIHVRFLLSLKMGVVRKLLPVWALSLVISLFIIWSLEGLLADPGVPGISLWSPQFFIITGISFVSMYLNNALGMGYGVTLIPILILLNFDTLTVLPTVLVTQFLAEIAGGLSHQSAGNIDLSKNSPHLKVAMVLAGCGVVGTMIAVRIALKLHTLNTDILTAVIGGVIAMTGIVVFATMGRRFRFSWRKIVLLGFIASFIKGLTGAGYGPIVTGGQVLCGVGGKQAVGVKSIAEGLTCLFAAMAYLASGQVHDLTIGYPLVIGAICSVPFSAYTVRKLGTRRMTTMIGTITIILGIATLAKAVNILYPWLPIIEFE